MPLPILGRNVARLDALVEFTTRAHSQVDVRRVATGFLAIGERYGIRGDVAYCQASLETGGFSFGGGTAVTPGQHNYGGLGVTRKGLRGEGFPTVEAGITAFVQHLFAYATPSGTTLPTGEKIIDGRFGLVRRGSALTFDDLSGKWAADPDYGLKIAVLYARLLDINARLPEDYVTPEDYPRIAAALLQAPVRVPNSPFDNWTVEHAVGWLLRVTLDNMRDIDALAAKLHADLPVRTARAEVEA